MPATPSDRRRQRKAAMEASSPIFLSKYGGLEKDTSNEWNTNSSTDELLVPPLPPRNGGNAEVYDDQVRYGTGPSFSRYTLPN